jgi:hypothetical protein
MSQTPISPLRQRMIEDMTVRKLGAATQRNYIRAVKALSEFLGRSPATATAEDLRRFQIHQSEAGAQPSAMNATVFPLDDTPLTNGSHSPMQLGATAAPPSAAPPALIGVARRRRAISSLRRNPHSARRARSPHYSRVPSLEAFGRRPRCLPNRRDGPASETLHISRPSRAGRDARSRADLRRSPCCLSAKGRPATRASPLPP